ncbi:Ubiquitin-specific protease [Globisporangium polare]
MSHVLRSHDTFQKSVLAALSTRGKPWNFAPRELLQDVENDIHHAGLVNPGCICYMNALVQQLFMIPSFREGLLSVDCKPGDSNPSQWSVEIAQLQKLFVSLAFTNFKSFDPTAFALSHRDLDGNPTDLRVQMDADEFFCVLLDRIDTSLHSTDQQQPHPVESCATSAQSAANFLENCFGGVLVNQIITQQGHISEREEKFFALSLEVSKKQHLKDSLALYVEGESLDGENAYFCERLQQKVSATKRICIKKLPQTLVCHLKRFEFDFDTMEKLKINDYLEFPQEIDMFPFTSEALSATLDQSENDEEADSGEQSMMYDLVGVVVHSGTSDMGHYYSFIKDRAHPQRWLEFNDEVVREFEIEMIEDECFGGEEVKQHWEGNSRVSKLQMKRRNAYMLIYERRAESAAVLAQVQEEQNQVTKASRSSVQSVSESLEKLIKETCRENALFQSIVDVFGPTYCQFLEVLTDRALSLPSSSSRTSLEMEKKLRVWDGSISELPSDFTSLQACVLGCQYLFGMASLQSSSIDEASLHSQRNLLKRILEWLTTDDPATDADDVSEKCVFSAWLLRQVIATPSLSQENMSVARSWIFDVVFLNESNPDLVDGCMGILSTAVSILTKQVAAADDNEPSEENSYRTVLVDFYRVLLDLFHDREQSIELTDPTTGGAMTLSTAAVMSALTRIGALLENCICTKFADSPEEQAATHQILATNLQFFDRLLFTLQVEQKDPVSPQDLYSHVSSSSTAALDESGISRVRLCTLDIERRMIRVLLDAIFNESRDFSDVNSTQQPHRSCIPVDSNLVLNQTVLANMLKRNLHEELAPVLVQIAERGSGSQRDKLLSLLMTVLEDVKTTHLEQMFHVFHALLDAEESAVQTEVDSPSVVERTPIHQHLFCASKGILEAAGYYKDHRILYEYTFQLLAFCVNRAKSSQLLQQLFQFDEDLHDQVPWIVESMTKYLDPTGTIRRADHTKKADETPDEDIENEIVKREINLLLEGIETAFGCSVFVDEDSSTPLSERLRSLSQGELPEYENSDVNQSVDDEEAAVSLEDVVPEFAEQAHYPKAQHAPKFSIVVKEEHGPEVEDEDEDDQAFNNLAPSSSVSDKKYSAGPEFTPRNATRTASRAFAMREFMYNNRGNEA